MCLQEKGFWYGSAMIDAKQWMVYSFSHSLGVYACIYIVPSLIVHNRDTREERGVCWERACASRTVWKHGFDFGGCLCLCRHRKRSQDSKTSAHLLGTLWAKRFKEEGITRIISLMLVIAKHIQCTFRVERSISLLEKARESSMPQRPRNKGPERSVATTYRRTQGLLTSLFHKMRVEGMASNMAYWNMYKRGGKKGSYIAWRTNKHWVGDSDWKIAGVYLCLT